MTDCIDKANPPIKRPLSAAGLVALVDRVQETGCAAEVRNKDVEIIIRPAPHQKPTNPADLIEP
ncbi:hypothetical protein [Tateyamaria sp.]|uniref:hypothetical protein n=1 Tax=Tateyamaria sp. TaxID=1929288 RepID=UPI003B20FF02